MKKILVGLMVMLGLQTQAQINLCDSLSYSIVIDSTSWNTLTVTGNSNGVINMVDSIDWNFTACNAVACYIPQGNDPYSFPLLYPQDTVKLCYDAFVYTPNQMIICTYCDSLIYDFMSDTWIVHNRLGNPNGIEELMKNEGINNKMYDINGRELLTAPIGQMYIQNRKKIINLKK